jgi:hypothetical protein
MPELLKLTCEIGLEWMLCINEYNHQSKIGKEIFELIDLLLSIIHPSQIQLILEMKADLLSKQGINKYKL